MKAFARNQGRRQGARRFHGNDRQARAHVRGCARRVAERAVRDVLTPERSATVKAGGKSDAYPVLGNIYWSEEAASIKLGGVRTGFVEPLINRETFADSDLDGLRGDVWFHFVRSRSPDDVLKMAKHMFCWVPGSLRKKGPYGDIARTPENDWHIMHAVTDAVVREQAALWNMVSNPIRQVASRHLPDMRLGERLDAWKTKPPTPQSDTDGPEARDIVDKLAPPIRVQSIDCASLRRAVGHETQRTR